MTDKHSPLWNIRSSSDDDENDEDAYNDASNPFYFEDDNDTGYSSYDRYGSSSYADDDDDYEDNEDDPILSGYGQYNRPATPASQSHSSSPSSTVSSSRYGQTGSSSTTSTSSLSSRTPSRTSKQDLDKSLSSKLGLPGSSSASPAKPKKSGTAKTGDSGGGLTSRISGGLGALRNRLPGGGSDDSNKQPKSQSRQPKKDTQKSGGLLGRFGQRDKKQPADSRSSLATPTAPSRQSTNEKDDKGKGLLGRIALPFGHGGDSAKSGKKNPPSSRRGGKKAKPLPKSAKRPRVKNEGISLDLKLDIVGWVLIIAAVIIFFGAISTNQGNLSRVLLRLIYQLVGVGWIAVPITLGGTGIWLIWRHFGERAPEADYVHLVGWFITYLGLLGTAHFAHLLTTRVQTMAQLQAFSDEAALIGHGGGWIGGQIYMTLMRALGDVGTFFALVGWLGIGLLLATDLSIANIITFFDKRRKVLVTRIQVARTERAAAKRAAAPIPSTAKALSEPAAPALNAHNDPQRILPEPAAEIPDESLAVNLPFAQQHNRQETPAEIVYDNRVANEQTPPAASTRNPFGAGRRSSATPTPARTPTPIETPTAHPVAEEPAESGTITLKPGLMRVRRPSYTDDIPATTSPADKAPSLPVKEPVPDTPKPAAQGFGASPIEESVSPATARANEILFGGVELSTPSRPKIEQPEKPATPVAPKADSTPTSTPATPVKTPEKEKTPAFDPDFMQPAKPRDPERAKRRQLANLHGAGLSPAERAALLGDFASDKSEEPEDEIIEVQPIPNPTAAPEKSEPLEETSSEDEPVSPFGEPVYETLDEPETLIDDVPIIEIEAPVQDDDDLEAAEDKDLLDVKPAQAEVETPDIKTVDTAKTPPAITLETFIDEPTDTKEAATPEPETPDPIEAFTAPQPKPKPEPAPIPVTPTASPEPAPTQVTTEIVDPLPVPSGRQEWDRPDFTEILNPAVEQNINDDLLLDRARIIEDTLASFGAPGKVVEVNPGPVITQFGVEPDYLENRSGKRTRVKVQAIARLADDLALSLAARSIRIEAPVPGKGFVGIEVPNSETSLVSLRDIIESPEFEAIDSKLRVGLGQSVDGAPVSADLTKMPHLLIAGTTGSGKSVCVNAIIACLLLQNTPDDLRFIMVDPKRVELTGYNGIPHLVAPVVVDLERIVGVLKWVTREMDDRYRKFNERGARNINSYNGLIGPDEKPLPYLVVVIDELADLMMLAPDETERVLTRLAQMARATGIHLIISTQRPSVDVVTGLIKANFPSRVAFAVASSVDSRVILDQPGAERLLGRGDMLFQAPDAAAPARLQGVYVSDAELDRLVSHWKGVRKIDTRDITATAQLTTSKDRSTFGIEPIRSRTEKYTTHPADAAPASTTHTPTASTGAHHNFWEEATSKADTHHGSSDDVDELYDEAVDVVRRMKKASVSLLQRQLRIGYTRAARLIDVMEERGIVGPPTSGSKPRKVIGYTDKEVELDIEQYPDTEVEADDNTADE